MRTSLARSYEFEVSRAEFYRAHRAEVSLKLRTGLVGFNAASALGVATIFGSIAEKSLAAAGMDRPTLLVAFVFYALGAWVAGWSLVAHYRDAVEVEGHSTNQALKVGMALNWVDAPPTSANHGVTDATLKSLAEDAYPVRKTDWLAIKLHSVAWSCWGTGTTILAISVLRHLWITDLVPSLPWT